MTSIRQTTTTTYTSSGMHPSLLDNGSPMDGSLDLLLEDLQSSVSRPGSSLGNLTNGHVTTTTTTTRRQQQSVNNHHYPPQNQYQQQQQQLQQQLQQHLQQQQPHSGGIQYLQPMNSTTVVTERASSPGHTVSSATYKYQYQYQSNSGDDAGRNRRSASPQRDTMVAVQDNRLRQNLNELDSLLVDLHHAQQSTPLLPSTTSETSSQNVTRVVRTIQQQQQQQQQQLDNHTYGTPNTIRRELQYPPSPKPERSSSLSRKPPGSALRAPSPTRQVTTTVKTYTYEIPTDRTSNIKPVVGTPIVNTYTYELPVEQPTPEDMVVTYKYAGLPKNRSTALEAPKEPATLVDRPPNQYSLHYSYTSSNQVEPPHRPFPSSAKTPPPSAEPPKRLEELMASFSDTVDTNDMHNENPVPAAPLEEYLTEVPIAPPSPVRQRKIEPERTPVQEKVNLSRNIAGPPVYYPPGVEMFAKKDEPVNAKMKEGAAASDSKSSGGGVAAVPVCLPVCCAMPCVIM